MLKTGDKFKITFQKKIEISDTEEYWVANNLSGDKFLIDAIAYKNYNFSINSQVNATVDHINCSGKIFLEPEHPVYQNGQKYQFKIIEVLRKNIETTEMVVADVFNNSILVDVNSENINKNASEVLLTVARVRKAIPVLFDSTLKMVNLYRENKIYRFHVDGSFSNDNIDFFVLSGKAESTHLLEKAHYQHYAISEGQTIKCQVVRIAQNGKLSLEPLHPSLREGDVLELNFVGLAQPGNSPAGKHKLYLFNDEDNRNFFMSARFLDDKPLPEKMLCKIDKFKKGSILVEPAI